jgi:hypothetical protein
MASRTQPGNRYKVPEISLKNVRRLNILDALQPGSGPIFPTVRVGSKRYEIQHPCYQETDADELQKRLRAVPKPLFRGSLRVDPKTDGNKEGEADEIKKMGHFFLPRLISMASITAR